MSLENSEVRLDAVVTYLLDCIQKGDDVFPFERGRLQIQYAVQGYLSELKGHQVDQHAVNQCILSDSSVFYDAIWELCRRGILRPWDIAGNSIRNAGQEGIDWYKIVVSGAQQINQAGLQLLPLIPSKMANAFSVLENRLGEGYSERSIEAIRCYQAAAYLGCCAMCGAASESIALQVAIAKVKDENRVLAEYLSQSGRKKLENLIVGQQTQSVQRDFSGYLDLLKYWRDAAAHGNRKGISETEAFISLTQLYRFALFVNDEWHTLTG